MEATFNPRRLVFEFDGALVKGDVTSASGAYLLVLHGAGQSRRDAYRAWREDLLGRGVHSAAFDCIGQGETGGQLLGSSLEKRTGQALRFIKEAGLEQPLVVVGSSMGAYTAIKLAERLEVSGLVLNVPAVYDQAAYSVPFGPEFSRRIRRERSWEDSDAWEILRRYAGDLLVVTAELDEVIPEGVIRGILESAVSARSKQHLRLKGVGHRFSLSSDPEQQRLVFEAVAAVALARKNIAEARAHV